MEPVTILLLPLWKEPKKDCYLVLFPKVLMILSVGKEMTSFTYEVCFFLLKFFNKNFVHTVHRQ